MNSKIKEYKDRINSLCRLYCHRDGECMISDILDELEIYIANWSKLNNTDKIEVDLLTDRYIVFGYNGYYPEGGLNDIVKEFTSLDEAKSFSYTLNFECVSIYDRISNEIVSD